MTKEKTIYTATAAAKKRVTELLISNFDRVDVDPPEAKLSLEVSSFTVYVKTGRKNFFLNSAVDMISWKV